MTGHVRPNVDVTAIANVPTDRVRWGPIIAGLFAALSTLAVLSVLGLAVGLTSYDAGDPARHFGIGAGIWGAVSALIAFAVGGWLAARTAAYHGHDNGLLQGAMVWTVAIPLLLYVLTGGVASMLGTAARAAGDVAQSSASAVASNPDLRDQAKTASDRIAPDAKQAAQSVQNAVTPQNVERAAHSASKGAWGTLISLILGLAASAVGGMMGTRSHHTTRTTIATPAV